MTNILDKKENEQLMFNIIKNVAYSYITPNDQMQKIDNSLMLTEKQKNIAKNCIRFTNTFNCIQDNAGNIITCLYNLFFSKKKLF